MHGVVDFPNMNDETVSSYYSSLDNFIDDAANSLPTLNRGQILEGAVVDVRQEAVIVDVGYKSEGIVAGRELKTEAFDPTLLEPGQTVMVYVVKPEDDEGQLILSFRRTQQVGKWIELEKALKDNNVVEAEVVEANNGGVIVELGGGIRGFIPTSQLDATRVYSGGQRQVGKDISQKVQLQLNTLVSQKINTRIIELDREKNRIILSEKMVTQERDLERREKTLSSVKEGDELKGEISGITPFGVFVNAEGLEGLVHLSELSWDKVENIEELYGVGDKIDVMVIGISDNGKRVAYSIKRLLDDPWGAVIAKYGVGDVVKGEVQKVVDFGAFVRIDQGINGLVHISEMSDRLVKDPNQIVKSGDDVYVKILTISSTERHLGLSIKAVNQETGEVIEKAAVKAKTMKIKSEISSEETEEVKEVGKEEISKQLDEVLED